MSQVGRINLVTGHMTTEDDVALYRATLPDQLDPPSTGPQVHQFLSDQNTLFGGVPWPPDANFPGGGPPAGGFPGGGPLGGGFPGWGPPGGGGPLGGGPPPPAPTPILVQGTDKLVGNPLLIFTGDQTKSKEFIMQWEMYKGVNISNNLMCNPYQRPLFFMTYIQGPLVNEWIKSMNAWLWLQITWNGRPTTDEWLWDSTLLSFNQQYADILGQEKATAELERGFKMEKGNIDAYIAKFEQVVQQARLDVDQPLVVNKFVRGLPQAMYDFIYTHKRPQMYEQWRHEAFDLQKTFVHLQNCIDDFKTNSMKQSQGNWKGVTPARDPNAVDTSPGSARARLTSAKELQLRDGKYMSMQGKGWNRNTPPRVPREVLCYRCQKPGHMIGDCPQPPQQRQWSPRQNTSQGQSMETDKNKQIARLVVDNRTPQQKAKEWLEGVANEDDNVKDIVMQELWKKEDFPNAWTQLPGWGLFIVTLYTLPTINLWEFQYQFIQVTSWQTSRLWLTPEPPTTSYTQTLQNEWDWGWGNYPIQRKSLTLTTPQINQGWSLITLI
jgi:hypothetical protein